MPKCNRCDDTGRELLFTSAGGPCHCPAGRALTDQEPVYHGPSIDCGQGCLFCGNGLISQNTGCVNCVSVDPPNPLPAASLASPPPSSGANGTKRHQYHRKTFPKRGDS